MLKLLDKFTTEQTEANARKLVAYLNKHPMTACFASPRDVETIERAKQMVA